ncbi:sensor histidine kinase [Paenibacillus filicis]|uniref:histidine kinase n=1 Tax=Paenibacillus filicis TaxID=669464 RepID=A0ABU9DCR3_9BACL
MIQEEISLGALDKVKQVNKSLSFLTEDVDQLSLYLFRHETVQQVLAKSGERSPLEKYSDAKQIQQLLQSVLDSKRMNVQIYLAGLNGDRYFTGDYLPLKYDKYRENWGIIRKAKAAGGKLVWDTPYTAQPISRQTGVLSAGRVIKHISAGYTLGYLIIEMMEPSLSNIYRTGTDGADRDNRMLLLDSQGYLISGELNQTPAGTRFEYAGLGRILDGKQGYMETRWSDEAYIAVYDTEDATGFKIVNFIAKRQFADKIGQIRSMTIVLAAIGLLVAAWLAYFLSQTVTRPLTSLGQLMQKVETGQLQVRFKARYHDDIGTLGSSFNTMVERLGALIQEVYEKKVHLREAELKALQAQIKPHFLYNTLETVNWMAKKNGIPAISSIVVALAEMLRYSIRKNIQLVRVSDDVKQLQHYLTIQQIRHGERFLVTVEVADDALDCFMPALLLQPLVENAIVHGLEMKLGQGRLDVGIRVTGGQLHIQIEDDGVGMDEVMLEKLRSGVELPDGREHTGIGLNNVRSRLELLYPGRSGFDITSLAGQGTRIRLVLPADRERRETP